MVRAVGRVRPRSPPPLAATKHEPEFRQQITLFQVRRFIRSDRISSNAHEPHELHGLLEKNSIQTIQQGRREFAQRSVHLHAHDYSYFLCCTQLAAGTVFDPLVAWPSATSEVVLATTDFLAGGAPFKIEIPIGITSPDKQSISCPSAPTQVDRISDIRLYSPRMQSHVHTHERVL